LKRFAVVGLGSFGLALARSLARLGVEVTAVDVDLANVDLVKDEVHAAIRIDGRDRESLEAQGVHDVDCAIVCMGEDFEAAELAAVHLNDLGCPRVLVRGTTRERGEILQALGPEVIAPGAQAASALALTLVATGIKVYAPFPGDHGVATIEVPESGEGHTLAEFLPDRHGAHVLAVRRGTGANAEVFVGPSESQPLRVKDTIYLLGTEKQLLRF
jgi:trk system potassium uptake protein TrkA